MKRRREAVATCEECNKQFELQESAQLFIAQSFATVSGNKECIVNGLTTEVNLEAENVLEHCCGTEQSSDDEVPETNEIRLMEEILNCKQEGFAADEPASDDFFPFPNETFFLLYCYAQCHEAQG